jgi:hypothetical protein
LADVLVLFAPFLGLLVGPCSPGEVVRAHAFGSTLGKRKAVCRQPISGSLFGSGLGSGNYCGHSHYGDSKNKLAHFYPSLFDPSGHRCSTLIRCRMVSRLRGLASE